ncbi:ras GTPase-activating protein-binding protein 1 isoform X1 [Schistocerca cancellata]|uniref:ras GTPase-activating protein-binding protein 1 isoform X1 n=1 Tax=Schistocerca cancellata TaxID=274614 RepID=UPI002117F7E0|nr:ras GTPase-activating protein-binding protein 1 isoform X1 [Schistocerca cancellata]
MVMEAAPSPQCVGREFVRQYYTLLNKAPAHLHRFYNNNSSFVHGGLDAPNRETTPVIGQKQIHQKIQQLNFHDCHAKISQVDSQATLGDGVVVQVTGELSNSGQPMRRFTQTFVLAAQAPRQYYVHNDIFRYQDMILSDEEVEQDSGRSEAEDDAESELHPAPEVIQPRVQQQPVSQAVAYYNSTGPIPTPVPPTNTAPATTVQPQQQLQQPAQQQQPPPQQQVPLQLPTSQPLQQSQQQSPQLPLQQVASGPASIGPTPQVLPASQPVTVPNSGASVPNGTHSDDSSSGTVQQTQQVIAPQEEVSAPEVNEEHGTDEEHDVQLGQRDSNTADEDKGQLQETLDDTQQIIESASSEPKTYATLVKTGGIGIGTASFSSIATATGAAVKPTSSPPPMVQHGVDSQMAGLSGPGGLSQGQRGARARGGGSIRGVIRPDRSSGTGRGTFGDDNGNVTADADSRRIGTGIMQQYPDSHQLFLGNIPHHATEEDLKELFSAYGRIVNLRIHAKQNTGNRPNYGFIIYEEASSVQTLLNKRPIYFQDQKLNVEEKKTSSNRLRVDQQGRLGSSGDTLIAGGRANSGLGGPRGGMIRGGTGLHRGGGRGGFGRGEGRGGGMTRGNYRR